MCLGETLCILSGVCPTTLRFIEGTVSDYYLGAYLTNVTDSATGRKTHGPLAQWIDSAAAASS